MSWQIALYDLEFLDKKLRLVLADMESHFGGGVITSLYRIGDSGVHGTLPLRGIDLRCSALEWGRAVEDYLNKRWSYDPSRPEMKICSYHNVDKGWHLHLQVHPETLRRKEELT
jgi:hypothetical protein